MMLDEDRTDLDRPGPGDIDASPAPIVIVQRGTSGWGRELVLLALLLSAAGYIIYQEYRLPSFLERDEPRLSSRMVDAVPVASVAEGKVVLRSETDPVVEEDGGVKPTNPPIDDRPSADSAPAGPSPEPEFPEGIASDLDERAIPVPKQDGLALNASGLLPDAIRDLGDGDNEGQAETPRPFPAEPDGPDAGAARSEIVWNPILREGQEDGPRDDRVDRDDDEMDPDPGAERPRAGADRVARRPEFRPPTLEQRQHFLRILASAIQREGLRSGPQIDALCRDFGSGLPPELDPVAERLGPNFIPSGWDIDRTVTALRRFGFPEPYLLDRISEQMNRTIGARHGPRSRMEARVFAARRLLAVPLSAGVDSGN